MKAGVTTFLMFVGDKHGKAEEAMNFYVALFPNSSIDYIEHYGAGDKKTEGTVKVATFTINGQKLMAMDSDAPHKFTFTPALSLYVECESTQEIDAVYKKFMETGIALMPLDNYGFSEKFGWVEDRFGVSWQINLRN